MSTKQNPNFRLFPMIKRKLDDDKETKLKDEPLKEAEDRDTLRSIMDRLSSYNNRHSYNNRDLRMFGLEDEAGRTVKIAVKKEDAQGFEIELQDILAENEHSKDELSVAEILFRLKDRFEIVDVKWPKVEQDEEVDQHAVVDDEDGDIELDLEPEEEDGLDEPDDDLGTTSADTDLGQVTTLMNQLVQVMQADASARQAEADARRREAEMREQELSIEQTNAKIRQEEQVLDMETDMKARKEQDQEVQTLAKLAQWKNQVAGERGDEDNEEILPQVKPRSTKPESSSEPKSLISKANHQLRAKRLLGL